MDHRHVVERGYSSGRASPRFVSKKRGQKDLGSRVILCGKRLCAANDCSTMKPSRLKSGHGLSSQTNFRNQSIARLLQSYGRIYFDPAQTTDLYTKQCSLNVSAKDLAVMGATLADGGMNPLTQERVADAIVCHYTLAVMTTAGLYETSGDWLYDIGLPGKSGISGGIVTVSPGKGRLGTFAPPLDGAGNSVKGQLVAKFLSQRLGMDLFVSEPEKSRPPHRRTR